MNPPELAYAEIERLVARFKGLKAAERNLEREIGRVNKAIDGKVYALYGLTEEKIKIVEGKQIKLTVTSQATVN